MEISTVTLMKRQQVTLGITLVALCFYKCVAKICKSSVSGNAQVPKLQLICYTSSTPKICLNFLLTALPIYIIMDGHFDYGIFILMFL